MADVNIICNGQKASVSREVADYFEQDKRRSAAEGRSDRRRLSMGAPEQAPYYCFSGKDDFENLVIENLMKESLRKVLGKLSFAHAHSKRGNRQGARLFLLGNGFYRGEGISVD